MYNLNYTTASKLIFCVKSVKLRNFPEVTVAAPGYLSFLDKLRRFPIDRLELALHLHHLHLILHVTPFTASRCEINVW